MSHLAAKGRRIRLSVAAGLAVLVATAHSQELRSVAVATEHDRLFVDHSTVKRTGTEVAFRYVLDAPVALEAPTATRRWRSNETGTGNVVGCYSSTPAERKPAPIVRGSTFEYLARHVCSLPP